MKIHRFFVAESLVHADMTVREKTLVNQLGRVLRVRKGEMIALCNGDGIDVRYEVQSINEEEVRLNVKERVSAWVPEKKIIVYLAPIRKERFEWALEKCTEIGVSGFVPLITERSERGVVKRERAEAIIREAAEQCGRGSLPEYGEPIELHSLPVDTYIVLDKEGLGFEHLSEKSQEIKLLIGPEGGWTDAEKLSLRKRGVESYSLGPTTLRAETAAVVACVKMV